MKDMDNTSQLGRLTLIMAIYFIANLILNSGLKDEIKAELKQSKEHHEKYHELLKENYRLNEWYQNWSINNDCDTFRQPTSVSINCEKYEL